MPGQFDDNLFNNPQMGNYGGTQPQQGWVNPQSQQSQWAMNFQPVESQWSGSTPGRMGQDYSYNPATGQGDWVNTAGGLQIGGSNPYGSGAVSWIDPKTGMRAINPDRLMSAFGGMFDSSGGGGAGYTPYEMTDYSGGRITAPGAYGGGDWDVAKNVVNVHDVIESYRPTMEAEIGAGFAQAGNRLGQSGFAMSTPYAQQLGDVERLARAQMNQRGLEFQYDAGKFDASNQMQTMMAENAEKFNAWQQGGAFDMAAQQGNVGNEMQQWMMGNQLGMQNNQGLNVWNLQQQQMEQQNQMQQQQFLAQLLGGLL